MEWNVKLRQVTFPLRTGCETASGRSNSRPLAEECRHNTTLPEGSTAFLNAVQASRPFISGRDAGTASARQAGTTVLPIDSPQTHREEPVSNWPGHALYQVDNPIPQSTEPFAFFPFGTHRGRHPDPASRARGIQAGHSVAPQDHCLVGYRRGGQDHNWNRARCRGPGSGHASPVTAQPGWPPMDVSRYRKIRDRIAAGLGQSAGVGGAVRECSPRPRQGGHVSRHYRHGPARGMPTGLAIGSRPATRPAPAMAPDPSSAPRGHHPDRCPRRSRACPDRSRGEDSETLSYLTSARESYLEIAAAKGWHVIDGVDTPANVARNAMRAASHNA